MKLSILLVTYNQEEYIRECLHGILMQQTPFDHEIVVADDHSSDATRSIIAGMLVKSGLIYTILPSSRNLGMRKNYKRGYAACKGEYIAVIEGDDYWTDPARLEKHVTFLDAHRECMMSFNRIIAFNQETRRFHLKDWTLSDDFEYITSSQLAMGNRIGNLSACVFRKTAIEKLPSDLFEMGAADWLMGLAIGEFGLLGKLKEPMSVYRVHNKGLWSGKSQRDKNKKMIGRIDELNEYFEFRFDKEFSYLKRMKVLMKYNVPKSLASYLAKILLKVFTIF